MPENRFSGEIFMRRSMAALPHGKIECEVSFALAAKIGLFDSMPDEQFLLVTTISISIGDRVTA